MLEWLSTISVKVEDRTPRAVRPICGLRIHFWFGKLGLDAGHQPKPEELGNFRELVNLNTRQNYNMS